MDHNERVRDLEYRIRKNKRLLKELDRKYIIAYFPQGYKEETSYKDEDTIRCSRKEYRVEEYCKEKEKIKTMIELDTKILDSIINDVDEKEYLNLLKNNYQKVKFLRKVKMYSQQETASKLGISLRYVQKIEKRLQENRA